MKLYGLEPIGLAHFHEPVKLAEVEQLLDHPKCLYAETGITPTRIINGYLLHIEPYNRNQKSHALALLHRDNLSRESRRYRL